MKEVKVITSIQIARPIEIVSNFASNPDNATAWYKNIKLVKWISSKPLRMDSQVAFEANFLGKKLSYTYQIIELELPYKMVMTTSQGPFPMTTTYFWEQIDANQTKMTLINEGVPQGFSKLVSPFMAKAMQKANVNDLMQLKSILEKK